MRWLTAILWLLGSTTVLVQGNRQFPCRFAPQFNCSAFADPDARRAFLQAVVSWEADFHSPGVGYNEATGFTYDGHPIDFESGDLAGQVHDFSAPSKESIHVALLALAVRDPTSPAATVVGGAKAALRLLERKMDAYEAFNKMLPGYGGYLPWVHVADSGIVPTDDWVGRVPALDNGEWIWSLYAAQHVLAKQGSTALSQRYAALLKTLAQNGQTIFLEDETSGRVRAVVRILNDTATPTRSNYQREGDGFLDDPYEGELFTVFIDLFGQWAGDDERNQLWVAKRAKFQKAEYQLPDGSSITVQRGWWFSSHEQWKLLLLPYLRIPIVRRVFANCERARSWNSATKKIAGLYASVNDVTSGSLVIPSYISAAGVQSIAFEQVDRADVVTGYGSYPLFLFPEAAQAAYCWYHRMLVARRGQGPYGSIEGLALNGTMLSPLVTWDTKMTTVLAMVGGIGDIVGDFLQAETPDKYQRFLSVVESEYNRVFPSLNGENQTFALPTSFIPEILSDFAKCQEPSHT
eukprot:TRINITY_DN5687_c0_g1_i1.p1 TRINITY_DN5687_c0_g1~~TRINITY_DN5687_c0_g1_i1.p1  ORF type:complete len:527 (-),score=79.40 TRINITY_DN5687_c0_g1_i1:42-1601(-)